MYDNRKLQPSQETILNDGVCTGRRGPMEGCGMLESCYGTAESCVVMESCGSVESYEATETYETTEKKYVRSSERITIC